MLHQISASLLSLWLVSWVPGSSWDSWQGERRGQVAEWTFCLLYFPSFLQHFWVLWFGKPVILYYMFLFWSMEKFWALSRSWASGCCRFGFLLLTFERTAEPAGTELFCIFCSEAIWSQQLFIINAFHMVWSDFMWLPHTPISPNLFDSINEKQKWL